MTDFWGCNAARTIVIRVKIESMVNFILVGYRFLRFGILLVDVEHKE